MYLDRYVLEVGQPNKWRYFPYICQTINSFGGEAKATITLDIVKTTTGVHSLIGYPKWEFFPFVDELPFICKHIFHFMELSAWATKDTAFWYVLYWYPEANIRQLAFTEKDWEGREEKSLSLTQTPFNLREIENL